MADAQPTPQQATEAFTTCLEQPAADVTNPKHYDLGVQPIEAIEAWQLGFKLGNAVKYIARADHKGSRLDDLRKARWYLDREIQKAGG